MSDQNGTPRRPNTINPETLVLTGRAVSLASFIIGVAAMSFWAAFELSKYQTALEGRLSAMASRLDRLERQQSQRAPNRWTYRDMRVLCREAERDNEALGWQCPDLESIKNE